MRDLDFEEERLRSVYDRRKSAGVRSQYAWFRPAGLLERCGLQAAYAAYLRKVGFTDLSSAKILDVGCGTGRWLRQFLEWGALPGHLHGIDLLPDRIAAAQTMSPHLKIQVGNGWNLPFDAGSFDVVTAHTVFSSILDPSARISLAAEMTRVTSGNGLIFVYDFRVRHPSNTDTIGISRRAVRGLFPTLAHTARSLTVAPPLARALAPVSPGLVALLGTVIPVIRTHNLHMLRRRL